MAHTHDHDHAHHGHGAAAPADPHLAIDPVCGMSVDPHTAQHKAEHHGRTFYFCAAGCRTKFLANPQKYLEPGSAEEEPVPEGTEYTCPMHPEIRQIGPGSCPICGMALEPLLVSADSGPNPELADMTRRSGSDSSSRYRSSSWKWRASVRTAHADGPERVELRATRTGDSGSALGGLALLRAGLGLAQDPPPQHVHADRHGTGVAYLYSIVATLAPEVFPAAFGSWTARSPSISRRQR